MNATALTVFTLHRLIRKLFKEQPQHRTNDRSVNETSMKNVQGASQ